ncbi:MAG: hypothetical protein ACTSRZ_17950 [Promethearchaeota archaeon]
MAQTKRKMKRQLSNSAILEVAVQISSIAISIYLIDMRGIPFLENSNSINA